MSRVDFAYGADNRLQAACLTSARHVAAGHRLIVYCSEPKRLQRFDALLWGVEPASFITHAHADDPLAPLAEVLLARDDTLLASVAPGDWLLNLDTSCPPAPDRFARILEIVSGHEADIQAARARWTRYQHDGHGVYGHPYPTSSQ